MRATKLGIELNKAELAALLAFTGDDSKFSLVHLRINQAGKLIASASDGKRAVECTAEGLAPPGEWRVDRALIEACRRLVDEGETKVLLKVTEKGLKEFAIVGIEDNSPRSTHKWPNDAASTQITSAVIHGEIGTASDIATRVKGSWFALNTKSLKPLIAVEAAANKCPLSIFPPKNETGLVTFQATSEHGAWCGVFHPVAVVAPGEEAEEDDEDDARPGTPASAPKALELSAPLATEKKKRAKASKRPAKKAASPRKPKPAEAASTEAG
jgi:hypothetical protein